ncbi:GNAT family N-acetyltransferase [bacterium]|nr:GNAT family N-acetyltransferase [bacterium]
MSNGSRAPLTAPSMVGRRHYLRPATSEDIGNTHHWVTLSEPQSLSVDVARIEGAAAAAEAFKKPGSDCEQTTFMLVRRDDSIPVARLSYFNVNHQNRSAEFTVVVDPDERRKGHGSEGVQLLGHFLFDQRGFNKVYTQVAESNHAAVGMLEKIGFKRDGTLRQHFYFGGEYHNGLLFSLLRFEL